MNWLQWKIIFGFWLKRKINENTAWNSDIKHLHHYLNLYPHYYNKCQDTIIQRFTLTSILITVVITFHSFSCPSQHFCATKIGNWEFWIDPFIQVTRGDYSIVEVEVRILLNSSMWCCFHSAKPDYDFFHYTTKDLIA